MLHEMLLQMNPGHIQKSYTYAYSVCVCVIISSAKPGDCAI